MVGFGYFCSCLTNLIFYISSDYFRPKKRAGRHEKGAGRKEQQPIFKQILLSVKGKKPFPFIKKICFITLKEMHFENVKKKVNQRTEGPESRTDGETLIFWE